MKFFEVSALDSTKVSELFFTMTRDIINITNNEKTIETDKPCSDPKGKTTGNNTGFLKSLFSFFPTKRNSLAPKTDNVEKDKKFAKTSFLKITKNKSFCIISKNNIVIKLQNDFNKANKKILSQANIIKDLEEKLNSYKKNLDKLSKDLDEKEKKQKNTDNIIISLKEKIKEKDEEIKKLNKLIEIKIKDKHKNINININRNQLMCINFTSSDQKINYAIPCIDTDTFAEVEEKLYREFPEYRETDNCFLVNGRAILRFKTVKDNKIAGYPVILISQND